MDIPSYLLGKKAGGGSSPSGGDGTDWSVIGYDKEPVVVTDSINYAKNIRDNWVVKTSYQSRFSENSTMVFMPLVDTSQCTNFKNMFYKCSKLLSIPQLDTSKGTDFTSFLFVCENLISIDSLDMSSATTIYNLFGNSGSPNLKYLGGFKNLGKSYSTAKSSNSTDYGLYLSFAKKLTHDSLMNIINGLYDIADKGCNTQQLNIGSTNMAKLTEDEIAIAIEKGWTVS